MLIIHIQIQVKPESIEAFKQATLENGRQSVQEPGIARFDFVQQLDDPARFALVEHYRSPADQAAHRETPHYLKWREAVAPMMAAPRVPVKYAAVFPTFA